MKEFDVGSLMMLISEYGVARYKCGERNEIAYYEKAGNLYNEILDRISKLYCMKNNH